MTGRSRTLRCANCMTKWKVPALETVQPEAPQVIPEPVTEPDRIPEPPEQAEPVVTATEVTPAESTGMVEAPEAERVSMLKTSRAVQAEAPPPPSNRGLKISVLLLLIIIAAILAAHRPISQIWPPSLRLFNALGLR